MFPQIEIKHNIGNIISIPNQIFSRARTYLSTNAVLGATTLNVDNGTELTAGAILGLLGTMSSQNAEIVQASGHTDLTITVAATKQSHNRGEQFQEINYDSISLYRSATIDGSYTLVTDKLLQVTQMQTVIYDLSGTTGDFYKVQWKNSVTSAVSDFSSPISVLEYPPDSAGALFESVVTLFGIQENDPIINADFLLTALNDARQFTKSSLSGIRHAWQEVFEHPIKVLAGRSYIDLPDDIEFSKTDQSLLAARFLLNNILTPYNMRYIDKRTWNQAAFYSNGGETTTAVTAGATTIPLNSVGDFFVEGGSAQVATNDYDEVVESIQYTGIDLLTNELVGVTGLTRNLPVGAQIWSRASMNQPVYYTVFGNRLVFSSLIPDSMQGNNCYIDYYKKMVKIENFYDVIPEEYREIYKPYLRWAIKYRKDITLPTSDPDLVKFEKLVQALFDNLYTGQEMIIVTG